MLTEVYCEQFRVKTIRFHQGMNVIVGDANATNSIGKSSALMVIDLCFGGKDFFSHNDDVIAELGHHEYYFTFQFDSELYKFCRSTEAPEKVNVCDDDLNIVNTITLEEYNLLLKSSYGINLPDITFRNLISLYIRIWGRENLDPLKPLHVVPNKKGEECVNDLIKTYDRYSSVRDLSKELAESENASKAWLAVKKHRIIPSIQKQDYQENQRRILELQSKIDDLKSNLAKYTSNIAEIVNREALELKEQKDRLLSLRLTVASQLRRVQDNINNTRSVKSSSFKDLINYFPSVDQQKNRIN